MGVNLISRYKHSAQSRRRTQPSNADMKALVDDKEEAKNIVVIGDGAVGKTSLINAYQNESLVPGYTPTMYVLNLPREINLGLNSQQFK